MTQAPILALALLVAASVAQSRQPTTVRVVDENSKPLAGARATLVGTFSGIAEIETPDVLHATSDAEGRCRVELLPWFSYAGWAIGPAEPAGDRRVTAVALGWSVGNAYELRAEHRARPRRIQIEGLAAWRPEARSFRVYPGDGVPLPHDVAIDEAGNAELPVLPMGNVLLELADSEGKPMQTCSLSIRADLLKWSLDPPRELQFVVFDEARKPIAGAEVRQFVPTSPLEHGDLVRPPARLAWQLLGVTDDEGRLGAKAWQSRHPGPVPHRPPILLAASKAGFGMTLVSQREEQGGPPEQIPRVPIMLPREQPLRGRVRIGERGVANTRFLLRAPTMYRSGQHDRSFAVTTDANGDFVVPDLPTNVTTVQLIGPITLGALLDPAAKRHAPAVMALGSRAVAADDKRVEWDLASLRRIDIPISDLDGGPARDAVGVFAQYFEGLSVLAGLRVRLRLDPAGRASCFLPEGDWLFFATDGSGWTHALLGGERAVPTKLSLEPLAVAHGRVTNAEDQPVAGARLVCEGMSGGEPKDPEVRLRHIVAWEINHSLIRRTVAGPDGRFQCRYIATPTIRAELHCELGGRRSDAWVLAPTEGHAPFDVRLK